MFSPYFWSLLLLPAIVHAAVPSQVESRQAKPNITQCLTTAKVPLYPSNSTNFTQAINPFNQRLRFTPVAVAVPTTVAQVQAAVSCGVGLNITISPKSGGHSYASHAQGGENGHLMVDLKYFNSVVYDNVTKVATVGPGSRLGNVAQALWNQGKAAISHGTCPGVGVGGHVLGGGYGYISHTHGLALDNLISANVVLANGKSVTASKSQNSDLFWALRGAGPSYGIVTSFKFQTFPAPNNNTVFSYGFNFNYTQLRNAHAVIQDYAATSMPLVMNMRLMINSYSTSLLGVYYGTQAAFKEEIAPLLARLGKPSSTSIRSRTWIDGLSDYAYGSLTTPLNYDAHETFFAKSLMTVNVNDDALDAFWVYYNTTARKNNRAWYLLIDLHGGPTSAITAVPDSDTSYAHRNALLKYEFYDRVYSGSYPSNGFDFLNGWVAAITETMEDTQYSPFGMYYNYADTSLSSSEAHSHYWLGHYAKLKTVKRSYDPTSVFSNPQAVLRGD